MSQKTRNPPSVRYPALRSVALGIFLSAIALAGASAWAAWALQGAGLHGVRIAVVACVWTAAALSAFQFWRLQFTGHIRWDGLAWTMQALNQERGSWSLACPPEVFLDLQTHIFLRTTSVERRSVWLWLERSSSPERWLELRRAVYSRAVVLTDSADGGAPANRHGA